MDRNWFKSDEPDVDSAQRGGFTAIVGVATLPLVAGKAADEVAGEPALADELLVVAERGKAVGRAGGRGVAGRGRLAVVVVVVVVVTPVGLLDVRGLEAIERESSQPHEAIVAEEGCGKLLHVAGSNTLHKSSILAMYHVEAGGAIGVAVLLVAPRSHRPFWGGFADTLSASDAGASRCTGSQPRVSEMIVGRGCTGCCIPGCRTCKVADKK